MEVRKGFYQHLQETPSPSTSSSMMGLELGLLPIHTFCSIFLSLLDGQLLHCPPCLLHPISQILKALMVILWQHKICLYQSNVSSTRAEVFVSFAHCCVLQCLEESLVYKLVFNKYVLEENLILIY